MSQKSIRKVIPSQKVNMGGHIIDQPLPNSYMDQLDPFLLIHHAKWHYYGDQKSRDLGVGGHPHRGFSPVTFVFEGDVRHQDSFGNDVIVEAGGTQWMHAGKGITHSERPSPKLAQEGGVQEFIQFWVNTPSKYKMEPAYYLPLKQEDTPHISHDDYDLYVVAGSYKGHQGPAKTFSPMTLLRGEIRSEGHLDINLPIDYNTLIYILNGQVEINDTTVQPKDLVWFNNDGEDMLLKAKSDARFIILSGAPISEEVTSYGPFVMNTQTEILEAIRDSQVGKMGVLIESKD